MSGSLFAVVGVTENLVPVLRHVLARAARGRRKLRMPLATRPEEIPQIVVRDLSPRSRRLGRYLALTDGLDLGWEESPVLPPLYPTAWGLGPYLKLLSDPRLDLSLLGMIHAQNDLISHRPIRADDHLTLAVSVERLHRDAGRALITVRCDCRVRGQLCMELRSVLVSGISPAEASKKSTTTGASADGWSPLQRVALGRHHPLRYALLSGDVNPVHLVPLTSRAFGIPRPILHGFCLKSIVAHALVRRLGGGDLSLLRRLRLRFRSPIPTPTNLEIQVNGSKVRAVSGEGSHVHADGRFRLGPPEIP